MTLMYRPEEMRRPLEHDYDRNPDGYAPYGEESSQDYARIIHSPSFRRLQGKMQLFPTGESPLLRTRLVHSLEVAEIAARICTHLNKTSFAKSKIDVSIVAAASLAHDIGHPPFGHTGEQALNELMLPNGGFEGNAQTLRIISKIENRFSRFTPRHTTLRPIHDRPRGLNLLLRTIAGTLKYDKVLGEIGDDGEINKKGYYKSELEIVSVTRKAVLRRRTTSRLYSIECQIMDLADDIAYSTYDLEDAMVAGLSTPMDLMSCDEYLLEAIALDVTKQLKKHGYNEILTRDDVQHVFFDIFSDIVDYANPTDYEDGGIVARAVYLTRTFRESRIISREPVFRRAFTEALISNAISAVSGAVNTNEPALSSISIDTATRLRIECLKAYNYQRVISSQRLRIHSRSGEEIVKAVFETLAGDKDGWLLPDENDLRSRFREIFVDESKRMRFVSDYVASMTDAEATSLYHKYKTIGRSTIFSMIP